jgi:homocysteine S-methyltransferase
MSHQSPLRVLLDAQGWLVLDGGLATALEAKGADLDHDLWSAKLLLEPTGLIRQVHDEFLAAGADCITTSTYQATLQGFGRQGRSDVEGTALLELSVRLACEARDAFWSDPARPAGRQKPLVAASIGPYGAFLADGSEYGGDYGLTEDALYAFHQQRWQILAASQADLLACETIPSLKETRALLRLFDETPGVWGWMSFSCGDEAHLHDGSQLAEAVRLCDEHQNVAAIGINCTSPTLISALIQIVCDHSDKLVVVYPNSGEAYDTQGKAWSGTSPVTDWGPAAVEWVRLGAGAVGGCCRTGAADIARIRRHLENEYC